ncbi:MAG: hypothetical protein E7679_07310 [Ruminococcaceae bacterium]|nr:hypothetical protein [Oscillospiraceae bacterium]
MNAEERKYDTVEPSEETDKSALLSEIIVGFLYSLVGFLLGGVALPFGAMPFGAAILCASDRKVLYIFGGLCLGALTMDKPILLISAYTAMLVIRVVTRLTLDPPWEGKADGEMPLRDLFGVMFSENLFLRMATSSVGAFTISLYSLIEGGFLFYDLWGMIIAVVAAPVAVLLTHGVFNGERGSESFMYISAAALAFGVIFAARDINLYGVSLGAFGAMFITLYVCRKKGMIFGIASAIICGLAYDPMLAPAFIFAAVAAGALWRVSVFFAAVAAFSVSLAWGVYADGISIIGGFMTGALAAALLFSVLDKLFFSTAYEEEDIEAEEAIGNEAVCTVDSKVLTELQLDATEQKIKTLCETFSDMSQFFGELGERMKRPLAGDIKQICDNAFDACCTNCSNKGFCWEENYTDTISAVATISAHVHKDGSIGNEDIPQNLKAVCERLSDITDEINHNCALHTKQLMLCDKTEIFALDYEAISDLLAGNMSLDEGEYKCLEEASASLCEEVKQSGVDVRSATVYGDKRKKVVIEAPCKEVLENDKDEIISASERALGLELEEIYLGDIEDGTRLLLGEKRKISVEYALRSQRSDREESFCGDTVSVFRAGEEKFYSIISDGMGSGRDAALTSGICAMFLQKMLSASNRCDTSLRMLNGFLRNKGGGSMHECSATVDLMELDTVKGKASFYKSGAAPTYVFRDGSLFKLRSKTVPVGIIKELDAKKISFDVSAGDVIVMVSDGVTQGKDECPWLFELLKKNVQSEGLEHTADLILERALRENGNDDISIVVVRIR